MPGVIDGLAASKATGVLANDDTVLPDDDAIGVGLDLDRASNSAGRKTEYLFLSKETRHVFETEAMTA